MKKQDYTFINDDSINKKTPEYKTILKFICDNGLWKSKHRLVYNNIKRAYYSHTLPKIQTMSYVFETMNGVEQSIKEYLKTLHKMKKYYTGEYVHEWDDYGKKLNIGYRSYINFPQVYFNNDLYGRVPENLVNINLSTKRNEFNYIFHKDHMENSTGMIEIFRIID